ncbi:hypothetical protein PMIN01_08102 [Paraphaeosphaeria minitans]|uniref:Uncharacterized protein n=1 Tax=Paraphaeosphaeria minitans TaxID=565426 RepID=A0A9P6GGI9_9PLEO|nr:hypothetical protein PMIN01_08102 [Paraphaeosphaeria minitans]
MLRRQGRSVLRRKMPKLLRVRHSAVVSASVQSQNPIQGKARR